MSYAVIMSIEVPRIELFEKFIPSYTYMLGENDIFVLGLMETIH